MFKLFIFNVLTIISLGFFLVRKEKETFQERMDLSLIISYRFSEYFFRIYLILIWVFLINMVFSFWNYKNSIENSIIILNKIEKISSQIPVFTPDGRVGLIFKEKIKKFTY